MTIFDLCIKFGFDLSAFDDLSSLHALSVESNCGRDAMEIVVMFKVILDKLDPLVRNEHSDNLLDAMVSHIDILYRG